jgi:hypothetical protein
MLRRDRAPDLLRSVTPKPFECGGLCFLPTVESIEGATCLTVWFQNRYSKPCIPTIRLHAPDERWQLENIEFAADGAEFGVFRRAINIPDYLLGRKITFEITGKNHFPDGRGRMVRFRDGLVVGQLSQKALNVITVAAAATGHIHVARTARVELEFPSESRTIDEIEHPDAIETLWVPPNE